MVNCDPWGETYDVYRDYCSFGDTWGTYIWIGLAVAALLVLVWAIRRRPGGTAPKPVVAQSQTTPPPPAPPANSKSPAEATAWLIFIVVAVAAAVWLASLIF